MLRYSQKQGKERGAMTKSALSDREQRDSIAARIMKDIVRRNRHSELVVRDGEGVAPIVVALEHDLLSDVIHRVRIAGGSANTFVQMENGLLYLANFSPATTPTEVATDFGPNPVHRDIEVGMFLLWAIDKGTVGFSIRLPMDSADVSQIRELANSAM